MFQFLPKETIMEKSSVHQKIAREENLETIQLEITLSPPLHVLNDFYIARDRAALTMHQTALTVHQNAKNNSSPA